MTSGPHTGIKPLLLPPRRGSEVARSVAIVVLVAFKLWSAQRFLRADA
jgi:hypothetical protein